LENFQHPFDTRLPERSQSPQERAADPHCPGSESQCLEHVRSAPDAAVQKHRNSTVDRAYDVGKSLDSLSACFRGPASVIGYQNAVYAVFDRKTGVLTDVDAFDEKL